VATPPESALAGAETILLVEDEEIVRELAIAILEGKGCTVLAAARADEALERMARHDGPIHLLLTDVILPGMSGQRLHQRVSAVDPEIRVLYMSGYTDDIIAPHGMLDPGGQFIQKPFSVRALAEKVRGALAG
jgi:DNA-binding NtrC family response regulator